LRNRYLFERMTGIGIDLPSDGSPAPSSRLASARHSRSFNCHAEGSQLSGIPQSAVRFTTQASVLIQIPALNELHRDASGDVAPPRRQPPHLPAQSMENLDLSRRKSKWKAYIPACVAANTLLARKRMVAWSVSGYAVTLPFYCH